MWFWVSSWIQYSDLSTYSKWVTVVACDAFQLKRQQPLRSFFNIHAFVATTHIHISDTYLFSIFEAEHHPNPRSSLCHGHMTRFSNIYFTWVGLPAYSDCSIFNRGLLHVRFIYLSFLWGLGRLHSFIYRTIMILPCCCTHRQQHMPLKSWRTERADGWMSKGRKHKHKQGVNVELKMWYITLHCNCNGYFKQETSHQRPLLLLWNWSKQPACSSSIKTIKRFTLTKHLLVTMTSTRFMWVFFIFVFK